MSIDGISRGEISVDSALNLIGDFPRNPTLLLYYVCLQKAEVLYANGEFELGSISNRIHFFIIQSLLSFDVLPSCQSNQTRSNDMFGRY